jgi:exopolyphosphatase/guanosine-5'-triphosphate,3'-diphosphate pyrophosphatase
MGVLDIGSNSAQLQIVDAYPGAPPLPTHAVKEPTLLGESYGADGAIDRAGVERVTDAVDRAMRLAERFAVERLYAFATSAVRDANNAVDVLDAIERSSGVRPQFLSGEDEARLTYLAVHSWYGWSSGRLLVLDIGGGSMEIVLGRDATPDLAVSLPFGAGRLTRAFLHDDPPTSGQCKELRRHIRDTLREVSDRVRWEGFPRRAIATSKTFKQLARLAGAPPQRKGPFVQRTLDRSQITAIIRRLASMTTTERMRLRGVSRPRARQILAGAMVAKATMTALDVRRVDVCPWALREGIILHYLQTSLSESWELPLAPVSRVAAEERLKIRALAAVSGDVEPG